MSGLVGASEAMRAVRAALEAAGDANVLVTGAAGTGKEAVARALHAGRGPFVRVDCAAGDPLPDLADGTVFLDEIGALAADRQAALAVALGASGARVVAGSVQGATALAAALDPDLYARVAAVHVALPPLSERREDIPLLVEAWVAALPESIRSVGLAPACAAYLASAHLEGNLRQLRELVERAAPRAAGRAIEIADLMLTPRERAALAGPERDVLLDALARYDWNLARTARGLGIALNTLKSRMQKHGIPRRKPV